jgi:hypothetical protein
VQVCRTFLAIGYTVTAVPEPMAVLMSKESRIFFIGDGAIIRNFTGRAVIRCVNWKNIKSKIRIIADDCII